MYSNCKLRRLRPLLHIHYTSSNLYDGLGPVDIARLSIRFARRIGMSKLDTGADHMQTCMRFYPPSTFLPPNIAALSCSTLVLDIITQRYHDPMVDLEG